jgi:hypothetical protein
MAIAGGRLGIADRKSVHSIDAEDGEAEPNSASCHSTERRLCTKSVKRINVSFFGGQMLYESLELVGEFRWR